MIAALVLVLSTYLLFNNSDHLRAIHVPGHINQPLAYLDFVWSSDERTATHEIDILVSNAFNAHKSILSKASHNVTDGAAAYRQRRGRHPPPGFDKWYARAVRSDAVVVEELFDQIYEDLEPFWGIEPDVVRNAVADWEFTLSIREGKVLSIPQSRHRSRTWGEMLRKLGPDLPDLDIAINPFDEPRVVAPIAAVDLAHERASEQKTRSMSQSPSSFKQHLLAIDNEHPQDGSVEWITDGSAWEIFRQGCRDRDPSKRDSHVRSMFVANWTASKDICQPESVSELHGALIEPHTLSMTQSLVPIFSAAKYSTNNDILLPAPSYYAEDSLFSVSSWFRDPSSRFKWSDKLDKLIWRGKATGGTTTEDTWRQFHRHRFVSMLNASNVGAVMFDMPELREAMGKGKEDQISQWLDKNTDAGFTDLFCGEDRREEAVCKALASEYALVDAVRMEEQYRWKYLPDIDGNSLSGRFRAFLRSNSAPIKATIVKEWHDSRLTPWVHFIPVDISFQDLWSVIAYFIGFGKDAGHNDQGRNIALAGQQWSERVLRREDMLLYMHRVLLEYARLCQDDRDHLAYVADLIGDGG